MATRSKKIVVPSGFESRLVQTFEQSFFQKVGFGNEIELETVITIWRVAIRANRPMPSGTKTQPHRILSAFVTPSC